jgi:hypothetical protein
MMKRLIVSSLCLLSIAVCGSGSKAVLAGIDEGFENEKTVFKIKCTGDSSSKIDHVIAKSGKSSLHMKVNKFFPKNLVSATTVFPVKAGEIYQVNISYRTANIEKNPNLKRQPALPEARIVFCNAKKRPATKVSGFVWLRGAFKNSSDKWQTLTKIIKVPEGTHFVTFTVFGYHKGDLWLDDLSVKKIN